MTTTYRVQGPDNQIHEFSGPDNATQEQVLAAAQQQFGTKALSPEEAANAAGQQQGQNSGGLVAGLDQAARQYLPGSNYVSAAARYAGQRITGVHNPDSFNTDLAYSRGLSQGEAAGSPVASTVGGTVGGAGQAAVAGLAGRAALGLKAPQAAAEVEKVAPTVIDRALSYVKAMPGAFAAGLSQAENEGQSHAQALKTGAVSAVIAPPVGAVLAKPLEFAASKLLPASARAFSVLAKTIGETPAALERFYDSHLQLTGDLPSMAVTTNAASQGALKKLAADNPIIGAAAQVARDRGTLPLHEQLAAAQTATRPQTAEGQQEMRDVFMDHTMADIGDAHANDPNGVLNLPHVDIALRPNIQMDARLGNLNGSGLTPLQDRIQNNDATLRDVETIRKSLRDYQSALMRPAPGSLHARDPETARQFGDVANQVEQLGRNAHPDYGPALTQYRAISNYSNAFQHGLEGNPASAPEGDTMLAAALKTAHGFNGYEHGNALYTAQQVLNTVAPGSVKPVAGPGAQHAAQALMATQSGGVGAVWHGLKAMSGFGALPDNVQRIIANQLTDPRTTQQAINNLRRARISNQEIHNAAVTVGGKVGSNMAQYLSQSGQ